jgi:arginyl-tRNA synthetase
VGKGARVLVEFVSVNPTGPLHVGHGRGAFTGDVLVNVLKLAGYRAYREYYVNDYGNQVNILAESVLRKYWQHHGIRIEFPDYCYQGAYVDELAKTLYLPNYKFSNVQKLEVVRDKIKGRILQKVLGGIRRLLEQKLGIHYDRWFSERSLYTTGVVDRMLRYLKEQQLLYRSEGALWMKTSQFGDEKDRVVIKANGEPVYFLSDIAYHWDKLVRRKFDKAIDIFGADHHGYIGRLQAAMAAVGATGKLEIIIAQMVRLLSGGQELKMSKRSGTFVTLEELVDEVGADAARFFFLLYDVNTHMDFDLDLAKKQSKENPVYYVQYAHARICSILGKVSKLPVEKKVPLAPFAASEATLLKTLLRWPELVAEVSQTYQVHKLPVYASNLATRFHDFYTQCRVIEGGAVNLRRLQLVRVTQVVLQNVLRSMGVSAPVKM